MAEALISSFGSSVGKELFKVFHQRIVLYCKVHREVEEMKTLGEQLNASLVKADELQARDKDENRREWMLQVRDAVCEIEVIMDMFDLEERLRKYHSFILRCAFIPRRWARLCRISDKILQIKPKIEAHTMVRPWSAKRKAFLGSKNYNSLLWYNLEEWIVEEGAAPHLHHLTIRSCGKLMEVPEAFSTYEEESE
ncbi:hypothetical protein Syun_030372 [Stephania yunnanensis]|uniref:Disease resistance N-terminal domain-containing protein n=1 Tax=Stephania yunnanensis TaxID=152371 RepID=A0AAP0EAD1_9MAGN